MAVFIDHKCSERCICPEHRTELAWWPAGNEHACTVPECRYARGLETQLREEVREYWTSGPGARPLYGVWR